MGQLCRECEQPGTCIFLSSYPKSEKHPQSTAFVNYACTKGGFTGNTSGEGISRYTAEKIAIKAALKDIRQKFPDFPEDITWNDQRIVNHLRRY